jgi:hypothetical protein
MPSLGDPLYDPRLAQRWIFEAHKNQVDLIALLCGPLHKNEFPMASKGGIQCEIGAGYQ